MKGEKITVFFFFFLAIINVLSETEHCKKHEEAL